MIFRVYKLHGISPMIVEVQCGPLRASFSDGNAIIFVGNKNSENECPIV
jgi:hypothetical protein